jgi:hypothetical protein
MEVAIAVTAVGLGELGRAQDLAVGASDDLDLRRGRMTRPPEELSLGVRGRDPGQRPDLRVGQLSFGERVRDRGQRRDAPCDPDVVSGRDPAEAAAPHDPLGARGAVEVGPALKAVEFGELDHEAAGGGVDVACELGDLGGELLDAGPLQPSPAAVFFAHGCGCARGRRGLVCLHGRPPVRLVETALLTPNSDSERMFVS